MAIHRRAALARIVGAGIVGSGMAGVDLSMAQSLRIRRPVSSLSANDPDLVALRRAIPLMKSSGVWGQQIALHADMRQRHHSSWRFLPWHRLQLVWFERQVARFSGRTNFALPYWDWDDDRIPAIVSSDPVLAMPNRQAGPADSLRAFMRRNGQEFRGRLTDDFSTFFGRARNVGTPAQGGYSGSAEWSGHNMIHGFVGGDMGRLDRSPNDPLFWMHHANIDRIWTLWHMRNSDGLYPKPWRDEVFSGFIDTRGRLAPSVIAAATMRTASFGYDYPFDPTPPLVFAAAPMRKVQLKTINLSGDILSPQKALVTIPADALGASKAQATGFLEVRPDAEAPSVVRIRSLADGQEVDQELVFLVPSGACESRQGLRINLDGAWNGEARTSRTLEIGVRPLEGRGGTTTTALLSFILDADLTWLE
ncbi:MAG: tyrosinase family protein [Caulobacteraceae bacterium]|nr:MAG: tyrosinase family protein [Caulobacteraceae bacterium]